MKVIKIKKNRNIDLENYLLKGECLQTMYNQKFLKLERFAIGLKLWLKKR